MATKAVTKAASRLGKRVSLATPATATGCEGGWPADACVGFPAAEWGAPTLWEACSLRVLAVPQM